MATGTKQQAAPTTSKAAAKPRKPRAAALDNSQFEDFTPTEAPPPVVRGASGSLYRSKVERLKENPGTWYRVFKGFPSVSQGNSRAAGLRNVDGKVEAVARSNSDGTADVFARYNPNRVPPPTSQA